MAERPPLCYAGSDAIVMGSRGLSGVRSMLLGSVSSGVVHHAGRPVLAARREAPTR